jgi:hypothetical protein
VTVTGEEMMMAVRKWEMKMGGAGNWQGVSAGDAIMSAFDLMVGRYTDPAQAANEAWDDRRAWESTVRAFMSSMPVEWLRNTVDRMLGASRELRDAVMGAGDFSDEGIAPDDFDVDAEHDRRGT